MAAHQLLPPIYPGFQASELWEVVEDPRGRLGAEDIMPERQEGHLLKKRKWPLKGWHKVGCQGEGGATCGICWPARAFMHAAGEDNCVCLLSPYPALLAAWSCSFRTEVLCA